MRVGGLGLVGCATSIFVLACGGQSVHEGRPKGIGSTGGTAGAGGAGNAGEIQIGSGSWMGGTVHPGGGSPADIDIEGLLKGFAGVQCVDEDVGKVDPVGITAKGGVFIPNPPENPHLDYCDENGRLVEYYCDGHCAHGLPEGHDCTFGGGVGSLLVTCNGRCLDGACAPLPE